MTPKLMQLYAMRAQLEAVIATEEAEHGTILEAAGCPHPEDKRVNTTTFGTEPTFKCMACGEFVKGQA
jgi:hypothetical protein